MAPGGIRRILARVDDGNEQRAADRGLCVGTRADELHIMGGNPWTHEFQSGSWTLPSISIETGMPEVPRYAMYSGCVLDQINWQMQRSGLLTATARLVAQGETVG